MSSRISNVLASIFLPRDSVYADLDDPPDNIDNVVNDIESTSPPSQHYHSFIPSPTQQQQQEQETEESESPFSPPTSPLMRTGNLPTTINSIEQDDPFAPTPSSPSIPTTTGKTSSAHSSSNRGGGEERFPSNATSRNSIPSTSTSHQSQTFSNQINLNDSKSPFFDSNPPSINSISPTTSRSPPRRSNSSSSASSNLGRLVVVGAEGGKKSFLNTDSFLTSGSERGGGSSAIGNRSLMGLLGGTRYGVRGFEGIESLAGGDGVLFEEEMNDDELVFGCRNRNGNRDGKGKGKERERERGRGRELTKSEQALAASLPPPPSALSPTLYDSLSTHSFDEEAGQEEEDDLPPDFTSRIPNSTRRTKRPSSSSISPPPPPLPSSSSNSHPTSWAGLYLGGSGPGGILGGNGKRGRGMGMGMGMGARERALWRWINVEDLDAFLQEVYVYYVGKGIWAIGLSRLLNLLTVGWVIFFSTFLLGCIDYNVLWTSHHLSEVVVPSCVSRFSGLTFTLFLSFTLFYIWRIVRFGFGVKQLWAMHEFYAELLEVPEDDIQTIPWHVIVSQLSILRASHPSALSLSRTSGSTAHILDAHDVANRIMREENYLIALFNKDVLDISIPIPEIMERIFPRTKGWGKSMLTRTLEWNLSFCLTGFLFGKDGQVRRAFLSERNRKELTEALRRRFVLMGLINAVFAPFIVLYLLMYSFFRYFEEYHKNPSSIGSRQFTQLARWKFREFNELPHSFQQRINRAHPLSEQYVNQFPKEKTALLSRFVAFLAGSFAAVLLLFSLIDPDAFLHFEITPGRTVLFYVTVFGVILAVARGMVPDENRVVDPEELMKKIVEHTHYLPVEWRGKLHSAEVLASFGQLFQMKIAQLVQELLSVVVTPFVLWYTLPNSAGAIVDFFREFTVHVDGLGYVCSFAVFDFKRHGDTRFGAPIQVEDDRYKSKEGKMEKSFLGFTSQYPTWVPRDQSQSLFLSKMTEASPSLPPIHASVSGHPHPHSRFPMNHSTNNLYPVNHNNNFGVKSISTTTARSNRYNFTNPTLEEESDLNNNNNFNNNSNDTIDSRTTYQRTKFSNPPSATSSGTKRSSLVPTTAAINRGVEQVIDEESGLDGDSYIATTETRPFGNEDEIDEEEQEGEEEVRRGAKNSSGGGLAGLLGEVYESRKW